MDPGSRPVDSVTPSVESVSRSVESVSWSVDSVAARLLDLLVDMTALQHLLQGICALAVEAIPDCAAASITLIRDGAPVTAGASDDRALAVDAAQYRDDDGPCLRAARSDADVVVHLTEEADGPGAASGIGSGSGSGDGDGDDPAARPTWPQVARAAGLTAVVSMPLPSTADLRAAVNLYAEGSHGWTPEALALADALVTYAGDAVTIGHRLTGAADG
jgi:hypothetical protein